MQPEKLTQQMAQFGQRLREIRKRKKLTLQKLEAVTGISNSKISKIENGMINVEFQTIARLADALEVEMMELFNYEGRLPKAT
jgi:transcriptional regulator with XRE-family HTH domain